MNDTVPLPPSNRAAAEPKKTSELEALLKDAADLADRANMLADNTAGRLAPICVGPTPALAASGTGLPRCYASPAFSALGDRFASIKQSLERIADTLDNVAV